MKQETLEEAAENYNLNTINAFGDYESFIAGAQWQQERSYSEEDLKEAFKEGYTIGFRTSVFEVNLKQENCDEWFEQFKNK
jgi:hypothetical protein